MTAGSDYTTRSVPIQLSATATRACFRVPILTDAILDDNEQFGVTLTTSSTTATVQIISSAVVTIIDVPTSKFLVGVVVDVVCVVVVVVVDVVGVVVVVVVVGVVGVVGGGGGGCGRCGGWWWL